jgi:hypothetical protein
MNRTRIRGWCNPSFTATNDLFLHANSYYWAVRRLLLLKYPLCYVNSEGPHDDPRDEPSDETSEGPNDGPIEGPQFDPRDVPSEWPSDGPSVERFILEDLEEIELEPIGVLC